MIGKTQGWKSRGEHRWSRTMLRVAESALCVFLLFQPICVAAQATGHSLASSASTRITVVVRGSISVSVNHIPLQFNLFDPNDPNGNHLVVPVSTTWNVSPREVRTVETIGYFSDSSRALTGKDGSILPAAKVMGQINGGGFQRFDQSNVAGPAGGSLLLFSEHIDNTNYRRTRSDNLELVVDTSNHPNQGKSVYSGVLVIEVRQL